MNIHINRMEDLDTLIALQVLKKRRGLEKGRIYIYKSSKT